MFSTIRGRIIVTFCAFFVFVAALTIFYWWSVASIRERLFVIEKFEDLLNNILEARRYEKNFFFYHDKESLNENLVYVRKVLDITDEAFKEISTVAGHGSYLEFVENLNYYNSKMESFLPGKKNVQTEIQHEDVRLTGKAIVDFAVNLLRLKRARIHQALTSTAVLPFIFLGVFVLLLVLVVNLLQSKVLKPLALIHATIGRAAEGDFSPIPYDSGSRDEISKLIEAFNRMAIELDTKQEQLVQSRKIAAIGTFTAGIAHELNNPINNIYLTAETLLEDHQSMSPPECKELILDVLNQSERAGDIVKNLLDFSRSEMPSFSELNIKDVIQKTLKLVKNQVMLAGINTELKLQEPTPSINGNLRNLEQVFLNLFLNAIQAMPGGGKIIVDVREQNHFVKVDVSDTGIGMQPDQLQRIFEPFYTTKQVGRGTGLGLAVSYALIKKHGGYIEVQSEVDKGTTFSIFLPVQRDEAASASQA